MRRRRPVRAPGIGRVDRRHRLRIDDISVEVHPEPVDGGEARPRPFACARPAARPHVGVGLDHDPGGHRLCKILVVRARADREHVRLAHERPQALEVGEDAAAPGRQCQILAGSGVDLRCVARMAEVEMAVDVGEAEATASAEREQTTEQDAAVAAEDDGKLAVLQQRLDPAREARGVAREGGLVARPLAWRELRGVARRRRHAGVAGAETRQQIVVAKSARELVDARHDPRKGRSQSEIRGRIEHCDAAPVRIKDGYASYTSERPDRSASGDGGAAGSCTVTRSPPAARG